MRMRELQGFLLVAAMATHCQALVSPRPAAKLRNPSTATFIPSAGRRTNYQSRLSKTNQDSRRSLTRLNAAALAMPLRGTLRWAASVVFVLFSALLYRQRRRVFWPGTQADPSRPEPLPPGSLGCPLLGTNFVSGSKKWGPEFQFRRLSRAVGDPRVWKTYFMGRPVAIFSGADLVQRINNMEFEGLDARSSGARRKLEQGKREKPKIFGTNNIMFERNKDQHSFLRRLVGAAMTPTALKGALPTIQATANEVIEREIIRTNTVVKMEDVCVDYTMDIVQNQLLGLQLPTAEVAVFRAKLKVWLKAMYSLLGVLKLPWLVKRSPSYKAKQYIVQKLEGKIDRLLQDGPDTSTLSNMLFATDDEDGSTKLTREQVVENAQLLVIAGSETSAGTLTLSMLLLGLHQDKYDNLVREQEEVVAKHGQQLTQTILDKECPYLDAVIKETLRMGPVTAGFPRSATETMVIDGVQVPENWAVMTTYRLTHQLDPVTKLPDDAHMDPHTGFAPERWLRPETTPSDWVPFGAGPRFCLGYHLAMLEMKVFLAVLARRVSSFDLVNHDCEKRRPVVWNPGTMVPRPLDGVLVDAVTPTVSLGEAKGIDSTSAER